MKQAARIFALSLFLVPALVAQDGASIVDKIVQEGRENSKVMAHLEQLTVKGGPRLTSSDRCNKACEWAKEQFEKWGLKASLDEWNQSGDAPQFKVGFNRGPWSAKMTAPEEMDIVCTTSAWSPGTNGAQSGPAVLLPLEESEVATLGEKLKGAWAVVTGGRPGERPKPAALTKAQELGVHGFLRSASGEVLSGGGNSDITWEKLPTRVSITLLGSQHKKIVALLKEEKEVKLTFDIKNEFVKDPKCYNVIADIVGSEKPDEYVVVGGHIDSWDGAQGATDNGTGSSTTLEAARILAAVGAKPKRTIRFMLWSGEEQGLLGSRAWCARNPGLMAKISACFVHDMGTNYLSGLTATEKMMPLFEKICEPLTKVVPDSDGALSKLNKDFPFKLSQGGMSGMMGGGSSDHASFLARGVPGFFWQQSGRAVYGKGWHTQHDKYDLAIPEYQQRSSIVIAIVALGVANLDELLPRDGMGGGGSRRQLGVRFDDDGVTVGHVYDDTPASKAGLKVGDKVVKIAGKEVKDRGSVRSAINGAPKETTIVILRDGKEQEHKLTFDGAAPAAPPRRLGIQTSSEDGVTVTQVESDMPAAKAGLKEGDKILKLGGKAVTDMETLISAIQGAPKETTMTVQRDGKEVELKVTFDR